MIALIVVLYHTVQDCAYGYTRQPNNGTSLGLCVACNCNNHADSCDAETGQCIQCLNHTTGEIRPSSLLKAEIGKVT